MNGWVIAATVVAGWSLLSVVVGIVLGHAMSGRPIRAVSSVIAGSDTAVHVLADEPIATAAGVI